MTVKCRLVSHQSPGDENRTRTIGLGSAAITAARGAVWGGPGDKNQGGGQCSYWCFAAAPCGTVRQDRLCRWLRGRPVP
jgi:hypothetical protein